MSAKVLSWQGVFHFLQRHSRVVDGACVSKTTPAEPLVVTSIQFLFEAVGEVSYIGARGTARMTERGFQGTGYRRIEDRTGS